MQIDKIFKQIQYNLLTQSGVAVAPEQLGLKSSEIYSPFNQFIGQSTPGASNSALPEPPTPPADPNDVAAQNKYQQEMAEYNQQILAEISV